MTTQNTTDAARFLRTALISMLAAGVTILGLGYSAVASAQDLAKSGDLLQQRTLYIPQIVNTASSGFAAVVGNHGTIVVCGLHAATGGLSKTCVDTSTNVQAMQYPSTVQLLIQDGNNDDSNISWSNVDIVLICDDIFGVPKRYSYVDQSLSETALVLGADSAGRTPYCTRVRRLALSNNTTIVAGGQANYFTLDSSDSFRLVSTDVVVLPIAPIRSVNNLVSSVCVLGQHGLVIDNDTFCNKASQCSSGLINGGRGGAYIDLSTCFTSGDPATVTVERQAALIRMQAGDY